MKITLLIFDFHWHIILAQPYRNVSFWRVTGFVTWKIWALNLSQSKRQIKSSVLFLHDFLDFLILQFYYYFNSFFLWILITGSLQSQRSQESLENGPFFRNSKENPENFRENDFLSSSQGKHHQPRWKLLVAKICKICFCNLNHFKMLNFKFSSVIQSWS